MREPNISMKNKKTGEFETISLTGFERLSWGFRFFADSELTAYKAAYQYRESPNGVAIGFSIPLNTWTITVFNDHAKQIGIDGAR